MDIRIARTDRAIEQAFMELREKNPLEKIKIKDLCAMACINKSTFYAHYEDIYALADVVRNNLEQEVRTLYQDEVTLSFNSNNYLKLFRHIEENQPFYRTYFKLGYDNQHQVVLYDRRLAEEYFDNRFIPYHMEFFKGGLNTIIKLWLAGGCRETPEEMNEIITSEYRGRAEYFDRA